MTTARFPTLFLSYGGGPWPYVDEMKKLFAKTALGFKRIPAALPAKPKAILVVSGHWEEPEFAFSTAEHPPTIYDYSGFPEHTYHIRYMAPGSPAVAGRIRALLSESDLGSREDPTRGFDHGVFVPLVLMYPRAHVPALMLSIKSNYDALEHINVGKAFIPLRSEEVLIIGKAHLEHIEGARAAGARQVLGGRSGGSGAASARVRGCQKRHANRAG